MSEVHLDKKSIYSGFYGLAIGDALGVPVEFTSRESLSKNPVIDMRAYGTHNQPKGTWSDDTSMSLATLKALSSDGLSFEAMMEFYNRYKQC